MFLIANTFEEELSVNEQLIIVRDIMHIRFRYFKKKGFKNMIRLSRKRILIAFDDYMKSCSDYNLKATMYEWNEFIGIFNEEGGIEFFELHAWL